MLLQNFYSVKNTTESSGVYTTELAINKQHHLYDGHFPDLLSDSWCNFDAAIQGRSRASF
ncbi:hypothetical protein LZ575_02805 [Antarcticibacterium sp. 1MA-6-2]|uniref:hypothetical protein n=1 Tax=Antarcticibacterium sp. 1MA-6-2 TaxID=2908210 RepID=UPI001F26FBFE|nr:hypothetical protein [Antarcticibacterium sp. 1MA-6-2]UJH91640.1 hypothetical protein LZ575_02805 [Antarcticibacterium sp. 1MA-6-2]